MVISIDLGSNTFRVALIRLAGEGFEILKTFERIVGSARGLKQSGLISDAAKQRIFEAIKEAKAEFDFKNTPCVAVATQAFRMAKNASEIFSQIKRNFGIDFKIISGEAEAKFTAIGVKNALVRLGFRDKKYAIIDLGGASTEIGDGQNFKSFEFGIITFFESCMKLAAMRENAAGVTSEAAKFLHSLEKRIIVLTSGVPTTMAAMKIGMDYADYDAGVISGSELEFRDFRHLADELFKIDDERADIMVGKNRKMPLIAGMELLHCLRPL